MIVRIFEDKQKLGTAAAVQAAAAISGAIREHGVARVVAATGASQFEFLEALTQKQEIDWPAVELFQLDEYIGLPMTHAASFSRYIRERLVAKTGIVRWHALDGNEDSAEAIRSASEAISTAPIDVAFVGIGENGHLAFNDPPADFETREPYILVNLDEPCRKQQVGEGWFGDLSAVPTRAISMSVQQILAAKEIVAVVPEQRKAAAVKASLECPISPMVPASILRTHGNVTMYLDNHSASLLDTATLAKLAGGATDLRYEAHTKGHSNLRCMSEDNRR